MATKRGSSRCSVKRGSCGGTPKRDGSGKGKGNRRKK